MGIVILRGLIGSRVMEHFLELSAELTDLICQQGERVYPEEGCGFVLGVIEQGRRCAREVIAAENVQNQLHAQDPERYPRDAKTAYTIDPKEMALVLKKAEQQQKKILAIFHSHPEHGVYFSAEDKGMAAPWGEPLFPDLSYVVVSVYSGAAKAASEFYWDAGKKDFVEQPLTLRRSKL